MYFINHSSIWTNMESFNLRKMSSIWFRILRMFNAANNLAISHKAFIVKKHRPGDRSLAVLRFSVDLPMACLVHLARAPRHVLGRMLYWALVRMTCWFRSIKNDSLESPNVIIVIVWIQDYITSPSPPNCLQVSLHSYTPTEATTEHQGGEHWILSCAYLRKSLSSSKTCHLTTPWRGLRPLGSARRSW